MKQYTTYICDKCGKTFIDDWDKCREHEDSHTEPTAKYSGVMGQDYSSDSIYPGEVIVPMLNGAEVKYGILEVVKDPTEKEKPAQAD